ncbi:DinB family protein [Fodinibius roseus]
MFYTLLHDSHRQYLWIIHGVHHRGQVAVLLRELGYAPGSF